MIPPLSNILVPAGTLAGFFVFAFAVHFAPAEADTHAAQEARQELKRDLAAARACAQGEAVVWLDEQTMACRREVRP